MNKLKDYLKVIFSKQSPKIKFQFKDIAFLFPYMKKHKKKFLLVFILIFLSAMLVLPTPYITGYIVDTVFVNKDLSKLNILVLLLISILLVSSLTNMVNGYYSSKLRLEFTYSIRADLVERILKYPMPFFNNFQTGYLVSRVDEVSLLGSFFSTGFLFLVGNFFKFIGALFFLIHFNLKLTLISLLILPLLFEISRRYVGGIRASSLDVMEKQAKTREKIQETLSGIEIIKSFAKEKKEASKIKKKLRMNLDSEILQNLFSTISSRMLGVLSGLNLLVILWISGYEIYSGRLTVGQYIAFASYLGFIYNPIQLFAHTYLNLQRTLMVSKRVSSLLSRITEDEDQNRTQELKDLKGKIEFGNVSYRYMDGNYVLKNISLNINPGEKVAFVGTSGSGKTTLINLILGLYQPTHGNILIDGVNISRIKLESLRNKIGVVSQNIFIFNDSILNNIKYCKPEANFEEIIKATKAADAHDFIIALPDGYDSNAGEVGRKLSGGQKQRISIARTLLKNSDVIIFDEPTAHLDSISIEYLFKSIKEIFDDKTCIIISHRLLYFKWVDKFFVLEEGKIVQKGKHEDLIKKEGRYFELLQSS